MIDVEHMEPLKKIARIKNVNKAREDLRKISNDAEAKEWMTKYPDAWEVTQKDPLAIKAIQLYVPALAKYL